MTNYGKRDVAFVELKWEFSCLKIIIGIFLQIFYLEYLAYSKHQENHLYFILDEKNLFFKEIFKASI